MSTLGRSQWPEPAALVPYGGAIVAVAAALLVGFVTERLLGAGPQVSVLLCAIMVVAWVGSTGAAVFATALAILAFGFFLMEPHNLFVMELKNVPRLLFFSATALFVVSMGAAQRRAADSLRHARDEQRLMVRELQRLNESLRLENAERKRAEEKASQAERELQLTIDMIPALVATYGADGSRGFINKTARESTGLSPADVANDRWSSAVHRDDFELAESKWRTSIATGEPFELEYRIRRGGEYRWHASRRIPLRDDKGGVIRWYGIAHDIEDRKRAEEALRRSEARLAEAERELQLTVDSIPALVATYQPDGLRSFANRTWLRYFGFSLRDVLGKGPTGVVHPDDAESAMERWIAALASGEPLQLEMRLRRADGEYRWHAVHRVPARGNAGEVIKWYSIAVDIEDRKRAEDALRRSEAQLARAERELRLTVDTIAAVVTCYRPDGERDFVNQTWRDYTGLTVEAIQGENWRTVVHPDDRAESAVRWNAALATGEPFFFEQRLRRADGEHRWHMVSRIPLRGDNGDVIRWYGIGFDIEDQKRAERALRESEAKLAKAERELRLTIDMVPALITVFGPDGEREFVNKTWRDYTGHKLSDIQRGGWRTVVHPDDHALSETVWRDAVATGQPVQLEHRVRRADGEFRRHMGRRVPLRDESGNIIRWYGVGTDIEDQKRAEDGLRRSEARLAEAQRELQLTIDSIPTLVASYSPDGARDFVNQVWRDYTGLSREDAKGQSWSIIAHPDDTEESDREWRACLATGKPFHMAHRLRRLDGAYRWHMVNRVPLRDGNGGIVKWYAAGFDIEDQKRAESALQRSEAYLAEAQKLSLTGSFGWVVASGEIFWSEQTYKIMGYDRTVKPSLDIVIRRIHPDDRAFVQQALERARRGAQNLDFEHRLLMHDGQVRRLHVRTHRVRYVSGQEEMVGAVMDITEARKSQEALQAAQADLAHASRVATLGEISASIAHEVNQPLAAIIANGQACLRFLNRETPDLNDVRGTVEWMVKDGNRASDVIRRVRALLNKADAQMAPLDVNDVIHDVVALLQRELAGQHVLLRLELAAALPAIVADRVQLQQVIINLVMNGIEAMQTTTDRRELLIRSHADEARQVVVAVEDRGVGITDEDADRLFHAFFSTKPSGLGMGLSICRSIIEVHGGRIWASANIGPGATFQFALPSQHETAS
jgi:PAS domain S-box-containing protein